MEQLKPVERAVFTAEEAAQYMGTSYWTVTDLARRGGMPAMKYGGRWFFRRESIDKWLDKTAEENMIRQIKESS